MRPQQLSFESRLERISATLQYFALPVPAQITAALGTHGPVPVTARVNDSTPFLVSLYPVGGGRHYIRIKAEVRKETGIKGGDRVRVQITVIDRDANVALPDDVARGLRAAGALDKFRSLPLGKQRFAIRCIDEVTKPETRAKRIKAAVEMAQGKRDGVK